MRRCIALAKLGEGYVAPNPMVGAILVYNDLIIGEGFHRKYGEAHAEVNCINSVSEENRHLVEKSTLYVSLEPCAHFGKTPPCADLIIEKNIPTVVIGCRDSFQQVDGKGIQKLQKAGIEVIFPVLEKDAMELNKRFFTFHTQRRPYIVLKWAQTANGIIGNNDYSRLMITNELTNREVHKWRSREASILIGTNTALRDNPALTTRLWPGNNPVRLVIDKLLKLPAALYLFDGAAKTIVFNTLLQEDKSHVLYYQILTETGFIAQLLEALYQLNIQSVLIEGGAHTLQSFIDENCWDEARVIINSELMVPGGVKAPVLFNAEKVSGEKILTDTIHYFRHV